MGKCIGAGVLLCLSAACVLGGCAARPVNAGVSETGLPVASEVSVQQENTAAEADAATKQQTENGTVTQTSAEAAETSAPETTATKPTAATTAKPKTLALTPTEPVTLTPTELSAGKPEKTLSMEQTKRLADCLNRQTVKNTAYKSVGEYTFTLGGQRFSVSLTDGWLNLLHDDGLTAQYSILLPEADAQWLCGLVS